MIVKENIPLLLSKSSLKNAGTILNMQLDKAVMIDQDIQLHQWSLRCGDFAQKKMMNSNDCENVLMISTIINKQD